MADSSVPWLIFGVPLVALVLAYGANVRRLTVFDYQRGLRYDRGRAAGVVDSGRHRYWAPTTTIRIVDTRATQLQVVGQEILSADGVSLRISLAASYKIVDVERYFTASQSAEAELYTDLQLALRELVGGVAIDDLLANRQDIGPQLLAAVSPRAATLGLDVERAEVRDIMFPGELKRMFSQVVAAQKEGQAALERARGESAALRNLANAAQAVSDNPALLQLRLLQQLGNTTGNTVVLSLGGAPLIVPPAES